MAEEFESLKLNVRQQAGYLEIIITAAGENVACTLKSFTYPNENLEEFEVEDEDYSWRNGLMELHIENWNRDNTTGEEVGMDGIEWKLDYKLKDQEGIVVYGENAFPDGWGNLMEHIQALIY